MLTIKKQKSAVAKEYFREGYYQKGRWYGKGAENLGLQGEINDPQPFWNVLDGKSPSGRKFLLGKQVDPNSHIAAIDCTFSAPKSVSISALVTGDDRLIEAHRTAVIKTLEVIESRYGITRVQEKGEERKFVRTGNLAFALYDHIESRGVDEKDPTRLDPHLHTHSLVMNMTQLPDGRFLSLVNRPIYENKKLLGMIYQGYLAHEVQKLGYSVKAVGDGQFELADCERELIEHFSSRRRAILNEVGENASFSQRNEAWAKTRQKKVTVDPDILKQRWQQEIAALGITLSIPEPTTVIAPIDEATIEARLQNLLNEAIAHCSEREVAFSAERLERFMYQEGSFLLECNTEIDLKRIEQLIQSHPSLIKLETDSYLRYTTEAALLRELATIRLMQQGINQVEAINTPNEVQETLSRLSLTLGQREAIATAATTTDQFIAWQGVAGAGKTYALSYFKDIAKKAGYTVKGFAPSAEAAKVLSSELCIESDPVASLLHSNNVNNGKEKEIWIVDEAGLLSASAAYELLNRAKSENARILFVGDTRQLGAVEAGNPFKSLQQAGMTTAKMDQSLRQKAPHLHEAVDLISKGEIDQGFQKLVDNGCIEVVDKSDKVTRIVDDYLAIAPSQRDKTLILAGTNAERLEITQGIRKLLFETGALGKSVEITSLKAKDLTKVQMRYTHHFQIGDAVIPLKSYKKRNLQKGKLYTVVEKTADTLTLTDGLGNQYTVDPLFEMAAYSQKTIDRVC